MIVILISHLQDQLFKYTYTYKKERGRFSTPFFMKDENMKIQLTDFLDDIGDNCSYISFLSIRHILNKLYDDIENDSEDKEELLKIIHNLQPVHYI